MISTSRPSSRPSSSVVGSVNNAVLSPTSGSGLVGNNVFVNNNNQQPSSSNLSSTSSFYVIVNGMISHAEYPNAPNIACSFQFVYGQDWEIVRSTGEGVSLESGMTQVSARSKGCRALYIWNFPIELTFRSTNPFGWPKLCVTLQEGSGKQKILGYGWCHVPINVGSHKIAIKLFKPQSTSIIQQLIGSLKGMSPEYYDSTMVCKGEGREVTRTECVGAEVVVEFNVIHKNMSQFGFESARKDLNL